MPVLTDEERIGTTLMGRYRLERILGRGGMGVVYAGEHTWSKRKVAVKLLLSELSRDSEAMQRFLQEARAATAVEHPNVVQVLDVGQAEDGSVFMAQELLRGRTLADLLDQRGRITVGEAMEVLLPIVDALAVAHDSGVVHRDLKPENVFLAQDATGRVVPKLLDFGIAKVARDGMATMTGTMIGSPAFMSPEQAECRKDVGPATDIWSMGVVFHRCLTGGFPVGFAEGASPASVLAAILTKTPRSIAEGASGLPAHVVAAVDKALQKEPSRRHASMRAFHRALGAETTGVSQTVLAPTPPRPAPSPQVATVAASTGTQVWTPAPGKGPTPFGWQGPPQGTGRGSTPRIAPRTMLAGAVGGVVLLAVGVGGISLLRDDPEGSTPARASLAQVVPVPTDAHAPAALDASIQSARVQEPVEPLLPPEPLLPLDASSTRETRAPRTRTSRDGDRTRESQPAFPTPPLSPTTPVPRPRPTVIDNGIRIPD